LPRDLVKTSTGFKLEDRDEICCVNQRFVFRAFRGVEITLVCLLTKRLDSCLYWSINTEVDQATRRLRIEAETQRFQEVVKPRGGIHTPTLPELVTLQRMNAIAAPWRPEDLATRLMLSTFREKLQETKW